MPFQPGQSGNPDGRPRGARNRRTIALENLVEGGADAITRKAIDMAKEIWLPSAWSSTGWRRPARNAL